MFGFSIVKPPFSFTPLCNSLLQEPMSKPKVFIFVFLERHQFFGSAYTVLKWPIRIKLFSNEDKNSKNRQCMPTVQIDLDCAESLVLKGSF